MASQITPLSASVTRILYLFDFPSELKTRDIQAAFSDWENVNGGFKIKWKDDTSLLIVFADASTAKRAYLQTLASPPAVFSSPTSSKTATIKPYDGADAQAIIQAVNARAHSHNGSRSHNHRSSVSINGFPNNRKTQLSMSTTAGSLTNMVGIPEASPITMSGTPTLMSPLNTIARDHSPTLPNVPAHPTLTSLINLSLPINADSGDGFVSTQPSVANDPSGVSSSETHGTPPRIGDPGRRMVGHALGIRHPSLTSNRSPSSTSVTVEQVQQNLAGLTVQE